MKKKNTYFYEMNTETMNILSIIILIVLVILTYVIIHFSEMDFTLSQLDWVIVMLLIIPYFIFHEILHSLGYVLNGANFKKITYGIHLEKGILCCSCKQYISKRNILWSLMYPFLFIGILTYIFGLVFNLKFLIILSIANISGCSADIFMFLAFLKIKDFSFFEYDNPLAFGLNTNEELQNKNFFGLKMIEEKNFKQTINKKISISKSSIIIIIVYLLFILLNYYL